MLAVSHWRSRERLLVFDIKSIPFITMKKLLFALIILTCYSCVEYDYPPGQHNCFPIVNMSSVPIWAYYRCYDYVGTPFFLYENDKRGLVAPGEINFTALRRGRGGTFENYFEKVLPSEGREIMYVFVIDATLSREWIEENSASTSCYMVRYDLRLEDLQALNWIISFPPDERMKDIHMYPPYQEIIERYENN